MFEIMEHNDWFFKGLGSIKDIFIIGHSCEKVDYPYFGKVMESVPKDAMWHFNPYCKDDEVREKRLIKDLVDMAIEHLSTDAVVKEFLKKLSYYQIEQNKRLAEVRLKDLRILI